MSRRRELALEALDWIDSLPEEPEENSSPVLSPYNITSPLKSPISSHINDSSFLSYFGDPIEEYPRISDRDDDNTYYSSWISEYKNHIQVLGLRKWVRVHRKRNAKHIECLKKEVDCAIRLNDRRVDQCVQIWRRYIESRRQYRTVRLLSANQRDQIGMRHVYKIRMYFGYWFVRAIHRINARKSHYKYLKRLYFARKLARKVTFYWCLLFVCLYLSVSVSASVPRRSQLIIHCHCYLFCLVYSHSHEIYETNCTATIAQKMSMAQR